MYSWYRAILAYPATLWQTRKPSGAPLSQSSVPIDLASAKAQIRRTGQQESHTRYLADPHSATHRTLTREASPQFHWRLGWSRSECITVALLRTGHSPLLASYYTELDDNSLHCVHTAEATTRRHSICSCAVRPTNYTDSTDPRCMMSFLETIGVVTCPPDREWETESSGSAVLEWFPGYWPWTDSAPVNVAACSLFAQKLKFFARAALPLLSIIAVVSTVAAATRLSNIPDHYQFTLAACNRGMSRVVLVQTQDLTNKLQKERHWNCHCWHPWLA